MDCFHPIKLDNGTRPVPCGKCYACLRNRQADWMLRLTFHANRSDSAYFLTLTYDDDQLPFVDDRTGEITEIPVVFRPHVSEFMRKLRYILGPSYNLSYYFVSEYGPTTQRPHLHALLFGLPP